MQRGMQTGMQREAEHEKSLQGKDYAESSVCTAGRRGPYVVEYIIPRKMVGIMDMLELMVEARKWKALSNLSKT